MFGHPTNEPKVCHIVERMAPGGIETLVLDLLSASGTRHHVLSLQGQRQELIRSWPALKHIEHRLEACAKRPGIDMRLPFAIKRHLRQIGCDTVILHHVGPLLYGGVAARLARIRRIIHVEHDSWHYQSPRRRSLARTLFALLEPKRVAVSHEIAADVRRWNAGAEITVIPPGIDTSRFLPRNKTEAKARLGLPPTRLVVGTVGRLVPVKGHDTLIDAIARLHQDHDSNDRAVITAVIVGDGPERDRLQALAASLGISSYVLFLGHRDRVEEILPAFDVFCLPSLNEGLPRSVLEAQASGVPVVASDVGALRASVCSRSGRLVPAGDAAAFADALAAVLDDRLASRLETPRTFVETTFSLTATLAAFARLTSPKAATP